MQPLETPVVIVTGAASGIGLAVAREMVDQGWHVVLADRNGPAGSAAANECGGLFVEVDVSNPASVEALIAATTHEYHRIDAVVNSAGITRFVDFFDIDAVHWHEIQVVNARGTFLVMQAASAHMRGGGGAIVNIASIAAKGYRHTSSVAYAASKGAVVAMTRAAAMQLARYSIRVNAICPGVTLTPLLDDWRASSDEARAQWERMLGEIPLGRPNETMHIAKLAAFLASPAGETVTGQAWNVDGGLMID